MTVELEDVAELLGVEPEALIGGQRVLDAVLHYAAGRYTEPTEDEGAVAAWDEAIIMQTARLCTRHNSVNGSTGGAGTDRAVVVDRFDLDVQNMLADFLTVTGIFGPSGNTD